MQGGQIILEADRSINTGEINSSGTNGGDIRILASTNLTPQELAASGRRLIFTGDIDSSGDRQGGTGIDD